MEPVEIGRAFNSFCEYQTRNTHVKAFGVTFQRWPFSKNFTHPHNISGDIRVWKVGRLCPELRVGTPLTRIATVITHFSFSRQDDMDFPVDPRVTLPF